MTHDKLLRGAVLLVDDDPQLVRSASQALVTAGFDVVAAASGAEALHHINQGFRPAMLITGARLPGIGGIELADAIRSVSPTIAVVLLSESAAAAAATLLDRPGLMTIVVKPFTMRELIMRAGAMNRGNTSAADPPESMAATHTAWRSPAPRPRQRMLIWLAVVLLIAASWVVNVVISRRPALPLRPETPADTSPTASMPRRARVVELRRVSAPAVTFFPSAW